MTEEGKGRLIEVRESGFNGRVEVWEELALRRGRPASASSYGEARQMVIQVGGLAQSGGLAEVVLNEGLRWVEGKFRTPFNAVGRPTRGGQAHRYGGQAKVKNFLILGFGGGTAARLARRMWPGVEIMGVEIDEVMVELGEKYIWEGEEFEVVVDDGVEWVGENAGKRRFDLVLVDMYRGEEVAEGAEKRGFFDGVRGLVGFGGVVLVNRLFVEEKEKEQARRAVRILEKVFDEVEIFRSEGNLWIRAENKGDKG